MRKSIRKPDEIMSGTRTPVEKDAPPCYKNNTTDLRSLLNSRRVQERPPQPGPQDCHQAPLNIQPWVLDWTTSGVIKQDGRREGGSGKACKA
jgi:hypothetical protein